MSLHARPFELTQSTAVNASNETIGSLFPEPRPATPSPMELLRTRVTEWNHKRLVRRHARRAKKIRLQTHTYQSWIDAFDTLTPMVVESFRLRNRDLERRPLISVLMPVYNADLDHLQAAVRSVQCQLYGDWELCIADDASTSREVIDCLYALARDDARIKLLFRACNGHISEASNSALTLAKGEYVALLDQDDLLRPHSLLLVAEAINRFPDAAMLYSDEDKIDNRGRRSGHYFKCDWNPYLFRSHNMVSHLGVYRRDLIHRVGGFRKGFEGAQDYDLALRCSEQVAPGQIVHLPFILYHWRAHERSTAKGLNVKPYARRAAVRSLQEHLERMGLDGVAESTSCGYRIRYALPAHHPSVAIIIPTRNKVGLLRTCIESIRERTDYDNYEIIVIDNGSDEDDALQYLREIEDLPGIRVIEDDSPFNFSSLNNLAVSRCSADYVCLLNNDIEVVTSGWLGEMLRLATLPDVGAVGAKLLYPNGTVQHAGVILGIGGLAAHAHRHFASTAPGYFGRARLIQELSAVTAACLLVKRQAYLDVGGLDEKNLTVAFNDVDLCLRLKEHGLRNVWTPYAVLYHHESVSRGADDDPKKAARFRKEADYMRYRWEDIVRHDPSYSPNLTTHGEDFELAFPPRVSISDAYWFRSMPRPRAKAEKDAPVPNITTPIKRDLHVHSTIATNAAS